jgi:hypothetical protein
MNPQVSDGGVHVDARHASKEVGGRHKFALPPGLGWWLPLLQHSVHRGAASARPPRETHGATRPTAQRRGAQLVHAGPRYVMWRVKYPGKTSRRAVRRPRLPAVQCVLCPAVLLRFSAPTSISERREGFQILRKILPTREPSDRHFARTGAGWRRPRQLPTRRTPRPPSQCGTGGGEPAQRPAR